jgi:hypothetical protein
MLHRLIIFRPVLLSTIRDPAYVERCVNEEVDDLVSDMTFWTFMYNFVQALMPLLRLIRMADSESSYIEKVYPRLVHACDSIRERLADIPRGNDIIELIESEMFGNEEKEGMIREIHLAAYAVDPEFWDDDVFSKHNVMSALTVAMDKIFYHHGDKKKSALQMLGLSFSHTKIRLDSFLLVI